MSISKWQKQRIILLPFIKPSTQNIIEQRRVAVVISLLRVSVFKILHFVLILNPSPGKTNLRVIRAN